jgi:hypothetical protein
MIEGGGPRIHIQKLSQPMKGTGKTLLPDPILGKNVLLNHIFKVKNAYPMPPLISPHNP